MPTFQSAEQVNIISRAQRAAECDLKVDEQSLCISFCSCGQVTDRSERSCGHKRAMPITPIPGGMQRVTFVGLKRV